MCSCVLQPAGKTFVYKRFAGRKVMVIIMYDIFSEFADFFDNFDVFPTYREITTCPGCGQSFRNFRETGKFGCEKCYETFRAPVRETLKQIHGNFKHTGKIPSQSAQELKKRRRYETLKAELSKAVKAEDYELAAKLHKELKSLGNMD